jgi:hypothetical protein
MAFVIKEKITAFFIKNENAVKWFAFLFFICLAFTVGVFHEPWADEAQSWLIARDTSLNELFKVMAYEGSPALWPLILKVFIFFGLPYRYIFIIPLFFSSFGVWLLIFKSKLPLCYAVILPFTYYLFYQYTAVARSYCLILPCMELIVLAFLNRLKNPFIYGLLLILFSSICIHTALLSGVLFLLFCIDIIKSFKNADKMQNINALAASIVVMLSYFSTILYIMPPDDYSFSAHFIFNIKTILKNFTDLFGNLFIYNAKTVVNLAVMIVVIAAFLLFYKISARFILIASAVWVFLSVFYYNQWHLGIILLGFLLAFQLYPPKPKPKKTLVKCKVYFNVVIGIFIFVQLFWSANTAIYDVLHVYSGAKAAAEFIKEKHYDQQRIYGLGYYASALEPYFDSNIYKNKTQDNAYYFWSKENGDLTNDQILSDLPPVLVLSEFNKPDFTDIVKTLSALGYQQYEFDGASFIKTDIYESQRYYVYVKENQNG